MKTMDGTVEKRAGKPRSGCHDKRCFLIETVHKTVNHRVGLIGGGADTRGQFRNGKRTLETGWNKVEVEGEYVEKKRDEESAFDRTYG